MHFNNFLPSLYHLNRKRAPVEKVGDESLPSCCLLPRPHFWIDIDELVESVDPSLVEGGVEGFFIAVTI